MKPVLQERMHDAMRLTLAGRLSEATHAIQRALGGAPVGAGKRAATPPPTPRAATHAAASAGASAAESVVLDGYVFEVDPLRKDPPVREPLIDMPPVVDPPAQSPDDVPQDVPPPTTPPPGEPTPPQPGHFMRGSHTQGAVRRHYKLYVPPDATGRHLPMVVMLHGCTQDADDFAAGTDMNERAQERGFFVLYPEQTREANPSRCWNWFKHNHQQRGRGEPVSIASLTQAIAYRYRINTRRIYIAGLSAGGAMAVIVAAAYPEIFAAVGVHSGLPQGAVNDVAGAMMLMNSGNSGMGGKDAKVADAAPLRPVPTIVFHGDQDKVVHPRNGEQVIASMLPEAASDPGVEQGISTRGRRYTRTTHADVDGAEWAEHWLVHGAGHAWSGGQATGTYTDASGPDATGEMLRFFFARQLRD